MGLVQRYEREWNPEVEWDAEPNLDAPVIVWGSNESIVERGGACTISKEIDRLNARIDGWFESLEKILEKALERGVDEILSAFEKALREVVHCRPPYPLNVPSLLTRSPVTYTALLPAVEGANTTQDLKLVVAALVGTDKRGYCLPA